VEVPAPVLALLERSRELGFLGPQSAAHQAEHALGFGRAAESRLDVPDRVLDLGSGGGLPGLVLIARWPETRFVLLDGSERRCEFLEWAASELAASERVAVVCGRAEELAHRDDLRGSFDLVVARSFGPPPALAECAAPFLQVGGHLLVSEPPEGDLAVRWPAEGLALVGLGPAELVGTEPRLALLAQEGPCPERFPRRVGVPAKRPLF
jgi:16S rRNA (guanine527-N7)-methyltransferase